MERDALTQTKCCPKCGEYKPTTEFSNAKTKKDKLHYCCKSCSTKQYRQWSINNPHKSIFKSKQVKAKKKGIEFALKYDDVVFPTHCPVFGIELHYDRCTYAGTRRDSPSFDRIDPSKGYVKGNVIIVSHFANTIKSDATVDELKKVAAFYEQLVPQIGG